MTLQMSIYPTHYFLHIARDAPDATCDQVLMYVGRTYTDDTDERKQTTSSFPFPHSGSFDRNSLSSSVSYGVRLCSSVSCLESVQHSTSTVSDMQ